MTTRTAGVRQSDMGRKRGDDMTDQAWRSIREEAQQTLDRLADFKPATATSEPSSGRSEPGSWRRHVATEEPKRRERGLDTAPIDWSTEIEHRVASMKTFVMDVIAQALTASFEIERSAVVDELRKRDAAISKLECEIARQGATIARLEARIIQGEVDHDRSKVLDLPAWPQRKSVN